MKTIIPIVLTLMLFACSGSENSSNKEKTSSAKIESKAKSNNKSVAELCETNLCNCLTESMVRSVTNYNGYIYSISNADECLYNWPGPIPANTPYRDGNALRIKVREIDEFTKWNENKIEEIDIKGFDGAIFQYGGIQLKLDNQIMTISLGGKEFKDRDANEARLLELANYVAKNKNPKNYDVVYGRHTEVNHEAKIAEALLLPKEDKDILKNGAFKYLNGLNYKLGDKNSDGLYSVYDVNQFYRFRKSNKKFKITILNHNAPKKMLSVALAKGEIKGLALKTEEYSKMDEPDRYEGIYSNADEGIKLAFFVTDDGYAVRFQMMSIGQYFTMEELKLVMSKVAIL